MLKLSVDGTEIRRLRSFLTRGVRHFTIGDRERHEVEIRIDCSLRASWTGEYMVELWVDGAFRENLLPPRWRRRRGRTRERARTRDLAPFFGTLAVVFLAAFVVIVLARWLKGLDA